MNTTITESQSKWLHGPQCHLTQWNYEPCRAGPPKMDGSQWRVLTKCGPLEKGMANHLRILALRTPFCLEKRQKDRTLKDELPRSVGAQYATTDQWRNNSRKNEGMELKWKQSPVVDVTGDGSKVLCCKEHCCIGTWNVRSMNQGTLEVVKQEMARVNIDILGELNGLKWVNFRWPLYLLSFFLLFSVKQLM